MSNGSIKIKFDRCDIVLKVLAVTLLVAAILKGHELLTVPTANDSIWTNRWFMIFQVEFELALSIWLFSGLFKRLAWLASLCCFSMFCCVTLYKGISGADSCGCFGVVHVNPWITLFAMDLPAVIALTIFRPELDLKLMVSIKHWFNPMPELKQLVLVAVFAFGIIGVSTPVIALNEPKNVTSSYEVLEPETWIGKELPILDNIDIKNEIIQGNWLIVLYREDCSHCKDLLLRLKYEMMDIWLGPKNFRIAFIQLPPHTEYEANWNRYCYVQGNLYSNKAIFLATPMSLIVKNGVVMELWKGGVFNDLVASFTM